MEKNGKIIRRFYVFIFFFETLMIWYLRKTRWNLRKSWIIIIWTLDIDGKWHCKNNFDLLFFLFRRQLIVSSASLVNKLLISDSLNKSYRVFVRECKYCFKVPSSENWRMNCWTDDWYWFILAPSIFFFY